VIPIDAAAFLFSLFAFRLVAERNIDSDRLKHLVLFSALRSPYFLGYRPPEEFEQEAIPGTNSAGATMSFFRHEEIYQSDVGSNSSGERPKSRPPAHRSDESPAGYSLASCSPAELASASPAECHPERETEE
jgi:hypothetical protein